MAVLLSRAADSDAIEHTRIRVWCYLWGFEMSADVLRGSFCGFFGWGWRGGGEVIVS
jgi:hypothetical protein